VESSSSPVSSGIALIERDIERWNSGDWDAVLADLEPDIEWHTSGDIPGFDEVYYGHEGVRRFWVGWTEAWASMRVEIEDMVERSRDLFVYARFVAVGREGMEVDQPVAFLFTFGESGLLSRFQSFWNRDNVPLDARTR
jgi:ketosteroid isomerase-like protein